MAASFSAGGGTGRGPGLGPKVRRDSKWGERGAVNRIRPNDLKSGITKIQKQKGEVVNISRAPGAGLGEVEEHAAELLRLVEEGLVEEVPQLPAGRAVRPGSYFARSLNSEFAYQQASPREGTAVTLQRARFAGVEMCDMGRRLTGLLRAGPSLSVPSEQFNSI